MRKRILPGVLCFVCAPLVMAADETGLPFADADELPMVLSATRLKQSLFDAPAAVTVIDRQMIEQSGVREIPELLRLVPGMVVGYESSSEAFVSYHGTSADLARRMQVLVDGRSIYQPLLASVDWIGLPIALADIERIEVIRGPNAASYGVNSFLAVVNIITRHPADVTGARIAYRRGESGIEDYQARFAHKTGPVDWRLSAAGRADDGYTKNLSPNNSVFLDSTDVTDSKDVESFYGRAVWTRNESSSVELAFGQSSMLAEQQYRPPIFVEVPQADRDNRFVSLVLEQELSATHHLKMNASHSRFSRDEPWLVATPRVAFHPALLQLYEQNRECALSVADGDATGCGAADFPLIGVLLGAVAADPALADDGLFRGGVFGREHRTEIDAQDTWVLSPDFRTVFGLSYDKAVAISSTYLGGREENVVLGMFAHAEWQLAPAWLLNIGGGQEWDEDAGNYFSPRTALNWHFNENQVLRLVYSKAVRTPDIMETSANWTIKGLDAEITAPDYSGTFFQTGHASDFPPAAAETIASREVGYYGRFDPLHLTVDIRLYRDYMNLAEHNLEVEGGEGFLIRQPERLRQEGAELAFDWQPWASQRFQLNYAFLNMIGPDSNDNTAFVPKHSGSAAWWQDYGNGWQMGASYYFYNDLRAGQFFFDRLDVRLAKRISLPGQQYLELAAVSQWRLSDDPELRKENGAERRRAWINAEWRY